ncbi:flagellar filament capping protein FliD [Erwinia psidii]|uniref:Flagellar hook-associated protein 2 n=1 Tax=Erwinia psidii TaxID=69224 RepID=A0A3N6V353_9GAMM|nr:flagellar filament capping protein FliD [Erwinia psidii]MCX8957661.1 flagellar filament capping protein FliD [Erwinia psidii]MCX8960715.1 flagellar filament capping protein FliD [Erwinia psidii]MCX8964040.1 flagellar filament capping protein FliD [Erwinia psidii]RQM39525.1 flagellar filament capping protein FliD [Erwinia psidii]
MLGVGSGLDLSGMLDKLESTEKAALTPITQQQQSWTAKISGYGQLKSSLEQFQTANAKLTDSALFQATTATSSSSAISATTTEDAQAGQYSVSVSQLAQAQTLTSGIASDTKSQQGDSTVDSRTLTVKLANGSHKDIKLTAAQTSLSGLQDAINGADAGVTASVVKVADGSYRLSLTASETGTANAISSVSVAGDDKLENVIGYSSDGGGLTESVAAQNAKLTVNDIEVESGSNTVSDALAGVTLDLNAVTSGNQTVTVATDTDGAEQAVSDWVDSYNALVDTSTALTKFTSDDADTTDSTQSSSDDGSTGPLIGDATVRSVQRQLQSALNGNSGSDKLQSLAQVGITTDPQTGKLKLDKDALHTAIADSAQDVSDLFAGDGKTTGTATGMASQLTSALSENGSLGNAESSANSRLSSLQERYSEQSQRISNTMERYKKQFTQLDSVISQLNSTSSFLTQQFSSSTQSSGQS